MVLTYCLNDFEMVPVAPIITGITLVFTFHIRCISIVRSLYLKIFSAYYYYYYCNTNRCITCNFSDSKAQNNYARMSCCETRHKLPVTS
jgi:hypothetical protein